MYQKWQPPTTGALKLYTDGAINLGTRSASSGGVLRDNTGTWITWFYRRIGRCSILHTELWGGGVLDGLSLAWRSGVRHVEVEMDNSEAVTLLDSSSCHRDGSIFRKICKILNLDWNVKIYHITREANSVADAMARPCRSSTIGLTLMLQSHSDVAGSS
ncbi:hypothetical protein F3Y22_tig00112124pilonHSYRG00058 [Hibiscus syriacus]|uniref:RNase H type-1 domain-containing protein n=1 Tax=Hibiscus syriacus TaxID=106335 RepID=A0A6A2XLA2_HIBSY|nr:hypothetical protein F3Y22_tig00112124pilonHSYRG00058 [Hibiscus syriacus]